MIYFIYKLINITGYGGVSIPTINGINGGRAKYGEFLLGDAETVGHLKLIEEFCPQIIPEEVFYGLPLIGITKIIIPDTEPILYRDLTPEELQWQHLAEIWKNRQLEYDSVLGNWRQQLDMMYWDSINNTNIWKDTITQIKLKYPI